MTIGNLFFIAWCIFLAVGAGFLTWDAFRRELFRIVFFPRPFYILIWQVRFQKALLDLGALVLTLVLILLVLFSWGLLGKWLEGTR